MVVQLVNKHICGTGNNSYEDDDSDESVLRYMGPIFNWVARPQQTIDSGQDSGQDNFHEDYRFHEQKTKIVEGFSYVRLSVDHDNVLSYRQEAIHKFRDT